MTKRLAVLAVAAVALAAQPTLEAGTRGGGHGGGRPSGGGRAVPRGSAPAYRPGGSAQARHPQAGAYYGGSHSGRYYGGYYGGSHSGRYYGGQRYYGYGYRPGYGYYRPRYYGSSFGLYFGFGDPYFYGSVGWGWPGYGAYGWSPYLYPPVTNVYSYSSPDRYASDRDESDVDARVDRRSDDVRRDTSVANTGHVRIEVRPEDASVYVDDEFWGTASEARRIVLRAGRHRIEIIRPGFTVVRRDVDVVPGETSDVLVELQRP
ncbi:MAG: PEGA domain-containing protein [Vicinamibacteria bacterium]